jgi:hypothetical protein
MIDKILIKYLETLHHTIISNFQLGLIMSISKFQNKLLMEYNKTEEHVPDIITSEQHKIGSQQKYSKISSKPSHSCSFLHCILTI